MKIDVLYVFETTKFTTAGKIESVMLVSGAAPGPVVGVQLELEPGVYRITNSATLKPALGSTFVVSTFDKGDGLPDPPGRLVEMFTSATTSAVLASNQIKAELEGQGSQATI